MELILLKSIGRLTIYFNRSVRVLLFLLSYWNEDVVCGYLFLCVSSSCVHVLLYSSSTFLPFVNDYDDDNLFDVVVSS